MGDGKGERWSVKTLVLHPCEPHRQQGEGTLPARDEDGHGARFPVED